jgi:ribosome assembly protein YihI (activator of Der GTPase)
MPKQIRARKRNPRAAGADKSRERVDAARNMIRRQKTKDELDAEARAEALLKKAQSKFYSLE